MLWINVRSFYGLGWLGVALQVVFQVVFAAAALYYAASWAKASLRVEQDLLIVGDVFVTRRFVWDQVASCSILPPAGRTPFLLTFWAWRDQARVHLEDGRSYRIRGIQPRHGFTVVTYFTVNRLGPADRTVDALNAFRARRAQLDPKGFRGRDIPLLHDRCGGRRRVRGGAGAPHRAPDHDPGGAP